MASIYKRGGKANKNGCYLITYSVRPGERRTVRGCRDKAATEALARKLETDAFNRREGVIDVRADLYAKAEARPVVVKDGEGNVIGGHIEDFYEALLAKGGTEKNARLVRARAVKLIDLCKAERLSELTPSAVQAAVGSLRQDRGISPQTCNHYLRAIKQFSRWLRRDGRICEDALSHLSGYNVQTDRRHDRRALTREELARLIRAAENGPTVMGISGRDRAMLYRLALGTGFRANELRSLTPESFALDAEPPTVSIEAAYSKHRHRDEQPIRRDLADLLRPRLAEKPAGAALFPVPVRSAEMMRVDLNAAGIAYRDAAGRVADFHALRHTAGILLKEAGVHPKDIQAFMRHSTITLTMDRYTHVGIRGFRAALDALPALGGDRPEERTAKATGTDDAVAVAKERAAARSAFAARNPPCTATPATADHRRYGGDEPVAGGVQATQASEVSADAPACQRLPTKERRGRDSNPGYGCDPVQRFSKPSP